MSRLSKIFVPKEQEFFDLFEEASGNILRAAELLERMLRTYPEHGGLARDILICEQDGDRITHDIIRRLNQTFVTPIDREDIYQLASALDDIVEAGRQREDVLAVDRRHERLVDPLDDVVRDPVAVLLADEDVADEIGLVRVVGQHLLEQPGRADDVARRLLEEVEELPVARDEDL